MASEKSSTNTDDAMTASEKEIEAAAKEPRDAAKKRKIITLGICVTGVILSLLQLGLSFWASRTVLNISAGSFWASLPVLLGLLVACNGVLCGKAGKCAMSAGISFLVVGLVVVLIGAIIDGLTANAVSGIDFSDCSHSPAGQANCTHLFPCHVQLAWANVCYCCHLTERTREDQCYFRHVGLSQSPSVFAGVSSCDQVSGRYVRLLWTSVLFCCLVFALAIVAVCAVCFFKKKVLSSSSKDYIPPSRSRSLHSRPTAPEEACIAEEDPPSYTSPQRQVSITRTPSGPSQHRVSLVVQASPGYAGQVYQPTVVAVPCTIEQSYVQAPPTAPGYAV